MIALLEAKAAGLWSRQHIANNVLAGLVVGIVALPLAMATHRLNAANRRTREPWARMEG